MTPSPRHFRGPLIGLLSGAFLAPACTAAENGVGPLTWRVEGDSLRPPSTQPRSEDEPGPARIRSSGGPVNARSSPIRVQPNMVYRLKLRLRRSIGARLRLGARERPDELEHTLGLWPGSRPVPPRMTQAETWLATSASAEELRLTLRLRDDPRLNKRQQPMEVAIEALSIAAVGKVASPPTPSANYVRNGDCEDVDEAGHPRGFRPWGGTKEHPERVQGEGRGGSAALRLQGCGYLLCAKPAAVPNRRFRFRLHAKGRGELTLRWRATTDRHDRIGRGAAPRHVSADRESWAEHATQTVVLPNVAELTTLVQYHVPEGEALYIDDVSVRMVGVDAQHASP